VTQIYAPPTTPHRFKNCQLEVSLDKFLFERRVMDPAAIKRLMDNMKIEIMCVPPACGLGLLGSGWG